ncbi:MAG: hypothetical protein GF333_04535 [Candidatus Omnitrophica bacterium]|nr:hypothetical protein [Candidatus Omnitrophota bacterium]
MQTEVFTCIKKHRYSLVLMLIDAHCHLTSLSQDDLNRVAARLSSEFLCVNSSIDLATTEKSTALAGQNPYVYAAVGFHPFRAGTYTGSTISSYRELISRFRGRVVAIGEIGIDYKADASREDQEHVFFEFLRLARECALPVMIHSRVDLTQEPEDTVLETIDRVFSDYREVVFHCYSYSPALLARITDKGGTASFSLNILRQKKRIIESLRQCPLSQILLETDSPYMRLRGAATTPLDLEAVYVFAAECKGVALADLQTQVAANAARLFRRKEFHDEDRID